MMANKLFHFIVQDFVLNQFVQDFPHWRFAHQQNVILGQTMTMFTCERCGKTFTEKRNILRHIKTHLDSSQTYSCSICDKVFSRADNRKRHEATHGQHTCQICNHSFQRMDHFQHHLQTHQRRMDETSQTGPKKTTKRKLSPPAGCSPKQRRTVSLPAKTHQEKSRVVAYTEALPDDPETRALYIQHWQSIRTEEASGNHVHERYNFTLNEMTASTFPEIVRYLYRQQTTAFKINVSFGFSYDIWQPVNYATTIPARTTPDLFMFHTSSELKKT
jgi:predicted RNA-binding Zn-ribbon protein involved in translation (DUF1610 family)